MPEPNSCENKANNWRIIFLSLVKAFGLNKCSEKESIDCQSNVSELQVWELQVLENQTTVCDRHLKTDQDGVGFFTLKIFCFIIRSLIHHYHD